MTDPETDAVHGDPSHNLHDPSGSAARPIILGSTFTYPEHADGSDAPYIYTRYANPTIEGVEGVLARLERTEQAYLFSSGMAAIAAAIQSVATQGHTILASPDLYGGTRLLLDDELPRYGVTTRYLEADTLRDPDDLGDHVVNTDRILYLESPTNPMLRVLDIPRLARAAHAHNLTVILDSTFAGPILGNAHAWGVDLVVQSATKSLGGHSDLIAGVVTGTNARLDRVEAIRRRWGSCLDPAAAYRLGRGLATLPLRVARSGETALALADALAEREWVARVHHPHRPDHPDHTLAMELLSGPLGILAFEMTGGEDAAVTLRRHLKLIRPAASLGGVETLLSLPSETSHAHLGTTARSDMGIPPGTVRLPVGLESPKDILADLDQAAAHLP